MFSFTASLWGEGNWWLSFFLSFFFSFSLLLSPPLPCSLFSSLPLSLCVSLMALVWCLGYIWCKCWVKESEKEQEVSCVQSGYPWLTLSRLRSSAVRQAFLGLLQSSVITLGEVNSTQMGMGVGRSRTLLTSWVSLQRSRGEPYPGYFCLPLRSSLCPADSCFEGWPPTMSSCRSPALWLPLGLVSGRTCRRKERSHFPFWQGLFFLYKRPGLLPGGPSPALQLQLQHSFQ